MVMKVQVLGFPRVPKLPQVGEPLLWGSHHSWFIQLLKYTDSTRPHQHHQHQHQPQCHFSNFSLEVKVITVLITLFHIWIYQFLVPLIHVYFTCVCFLSEEVKLPHQAIQELKVKREDPATRERPGRTRQEIERRKNKHQENERGGTVKELKGSTSVSKVYPSHYSAEYVYAEAIKDWMGLRKSVYESAQSSSVKMATHWEFYVSMLFSSSTRYFVLRPKMSSKELNKLENKSVEMRRKLCCSLE